MRQFTSAVVFLAICFSTSTAFRRTARHIREGPPCPEDWDIAPCTCRGPAGVPTLDCSAVADEAALAKIFQATTHQMNMRGVDIHGSTGLKNLPDNVFGLHTIHLFLLDGNQIESVSKDAFAGSEETVNLIRLNNNKLTTFPFEILSKFPAFNMLKLGQNQISEIPDNAFPQSSVQNIDLSENKITSIGKNAFAQLTKLQNLNLSGNQLTSLGEKAFANNQLEFLSLDLAGNSISQIDDTAFAGLKLSTLDLTNNTLSVLKESVFSHFFTAESSVEKVVVTGNPLDCDNASMNWVKTLATDAKAKFNGFECTNGKLLADLS